MPGLVDVLAAADRQDEAVSSQRVSVKALATRRRPDLHATDAVPHRGHAQRKRSSPAERPAHVRRLRRLVVRGQGGSATTCGIPAGVSALVLNVYAVNPTNLGFIKLWPSGRSSRTFRP